MWGSRRYLGKGGGLVNEAALFEIVSLDTIVQLDGEPAEEIEVHFSRGPKPRFSDDDVMGMLRDEFGIVSASAFQGLEQQAQREHVKTLRERRVSIRQIARVTGLSKGIIERWSQSG